MSIDAELENLKVWGEAEICQYLASKVRHGRRARKESQDAFAKRIGVAVRTYKRFETSGHGTLETFLRALKGIERAHYLFMLFPQNVTQTKVPLPNMVQRIKGEWRISTVQPD